MKTGFAVMCSNRLFETGQKPSINYETMAKKDFTIRKAEKSDCKEIRRLIQVLIALMIKSMYFVSILTL